MRLSVTPTGTPPRDLLAVFQARAAQAVTIGMRGVAAGLLADMRAEIAAAFPGSRRLPTSITGRGYPDRTGAVSLTASAVVRARSNSVAEILASHEGSVIRPRGRAMLAIPTREVPRVGGKRLLPRQAESYFGGKLEVLPRGTLSQGQRHALLVLRSSTRLSAQRGRVAVRRRHEMRVLYVLVPEIQLRRRLQPERLAQQWVARVPALIDQAWTTLARDR